MEVGGPQGLSNGGRWRRSQLRAQGPACHSRMAQQGLQTGVHRAEGFCFQPTAPRTWLEPQGSVRDPGWKRECWHVGGGTEPRSLVSVLQHTAASSPGPSFLSPEVPDCPMHIHDNFALLLTGYKLWGPLPLPEPQFP